jgi:hypothetical protein
MFLLKPDLRSHPFAVERSLYFHYALLVQSNLQQYRPHSNKYATKTRQHKNTSLAIDPVITEKEYIKIRSLVLKKVEHDNNSILK